MHERVEPIVYELVLQYIFPDKALLRQGDVVEVAKLLKNCTLILRLVSSEISCQDKSTEADILEVFNEFRAAVLGSLPCLKGLLKESISGKLTKNHTAMVKCALASNEKLKSLLERAAGFSSVNLIDIYHALSQ